MRNLALINDFRDEINVFETIKDIEFIENTFPENTGVIKPVDMPVLWQQPTDNVLIPVNHHPTVGCSIGCENNTSVSIKGNEVKWNSQKSINVIDNSLKPIQGAKVLINGQDFLMNVTNSVGVVFLPSSTKAGDIITISHFDYNERTLPFEKLNVSEVLINKTVNVESGDENDKPNYIGWGLLLVGAIWGASKLFKSKKVSPTSLGRPKNIRV